MVQESAFGPHTSDACAPSALLSRPARNLSGRARRTIAPCAEAKAAPVERIGRNGTDGTGRTKGKDGFLKGMKGTKGTQVRRGKGLCRFQKIIGAEGVLYRGFFVYLQKIGLGLAGRRSICHVFNA